MSQKFGKTSDGTYQHEVVACDYALTLTVWRREPKVWTFEANGIPSDCNFRSVHEAKDAALAWAELNAGLSDYRVPTVVRDWFLGERNVRFLANSSMETTRLWDAKMAARATTQADRENAKAAMKMAEAAPAPKAEPDSPQVLHAVKRGHIAAAREIEDAATNAREVAFRLFAELPVGHPAMPLLMVVADNLKAAMEAARKAGAAVLEVPAQPLPLLPHSLSAAAAPKPMKTEHMGVAVRLDDAQGLLGALRDLDAAYARTIGHGRRGRIANERQQVRAALAALFQAGDRVQVHPAHDAWMKGDRYGTVVRVNGFHVEVRMDRSTGRLSFVPDLLENLGQPAPGAE